jgi:hypothetical protein
MRQKILLQRTNENTAVVLNINSSHETPDEAMEALRRALTDWKNTTDEGRKVWEDSSEDFNVGHLAFAGKTISMAKCLHKETIRDLIIEPVEGVTNHDWNYDSFLMEDD